MSVNCAYCGTPTRDFHKQEGWGCCSEACASVLGENYENSWYFRYGKTEYKGGTAVELNLRPDQFDTVFGDWWTATKSMIFEGNKINAIKAFRLHTGLGLYDSKVAIESWIDWKKQRATVEVDKFVKMLRDGFHPDDHDMEPFHINVGDIRRFLEAYDNKLAGLYR